MESSKEKRMMNAGSEHTDANGRLVVVLSRNYSTGLSVIRSFGAAGYTVDLIASAPREGASELITKSRYLRHCTEVVTQKVKKDLDWELLQAMLSYRGTSSEKIILFPTDDYTTYVMDLYRDKLEDIFVMPHIVGGRPGDMARMMDKYEQGKLAAKAGLRVPRQWRISLEGALTLPENVTYPCFVKPIESIHGYKKEMRMCESEGLLLNHLQRLRRRYAARNILIQEYLEIENEIDFSGVCLDQKIIIPGIIRKTHVAEYEKGVTLAGKVVPYEELPEEIREKTETFLRSLHFVGMIDMEFCIIGGEIYFNEVNLRSGGPSYSYYVSGVNLPVLTAEELLGLGHDPEEEKIKEFGKTLLYEDAAWKDYINGYLSKRELRSAIENADITIFYNKEDPVPGEEFRKNMERRALRRKAGSMKRGLKRGVRRAVRVPVHRLEPLVLGYPQMKRSRRRNAASSRPRALVIGRNYASNLSLVRSLGEAGYDVEVVRLFQRRLSYRNPLRGIRPEVYSKYVIRYTRLISHRSDRRIAARLLDMAEERIESGFTDRVLLVTADDVVASTVDSFYRELSPFYYLQNVDRKPGGVFRLMNKSIQKELAKQAGLNVADYHTIRIDRGSYTIPDGIRYPCFVKPNISRFGAKSLMNRFDSQDELEAWFDDYAERRKKRSVEFLVEDYIEIKAEYSLLGISTSEDVIGPCFFKAEIGGSEQHRGVALLGRILPCEEYQELIDRLLAFIKTLHFEGLYDIDLIEAPDGTMYYAETNFRCGASVYAFCGSGVNLVGMYADYKTKGIPIDTQAHIDRSGSRFLSEKILIDEYFYNRIEKDDLERCLDAADSFLIYNEDDPEPYRHFKKYYKVAETMRFLNRQKEE